MDNPALKRYRLTTRLGQAVWGHSLKELAHTLHSPGGKHKIVVDP